MCAVRMRVRFNTRGASSDGVTASPARVPRLVGARAMEGLSDLQPGAGNERFTSDVLALKDMSPASLRVIEARASEIAAVLVSPLQGLNPGSPPPATWCCSTRRCARPTTRSPTTRRGCTRCARSPRASACRSCSTRRASRRRVSRARARARRLLPTTTDARPTRSLILPPPSLPPARARPGVHGLPHGAQRRAAVLRRAGRLRRVRQDARRRAAARRRLRQARAHAPLRRVAPAARRVRHRHVLGRAHHGRHGRRVPRLARAAGDHDRAALPRA